MLTTTINNNNHWHGLDLQWVYSDLLRNIFYQTKCMHLAKDVLHDSMLRFVLSNHTKPLVEPHAYLRVVVRNLLVDHFHQKSSHEVLNIEDSNHTLWNDHQHNWSPSVEQLADLQQRMQAIEKIINCLPPKCRDVFWLFRVEGFSQAEIAGQLNISINMVERHVARALVDICEARELLVDL